MPEEITTLQSPASTGPKLKTAKTLFNKVLATQFHYFEFEAEQPLNLKPGQYISVKVAPDAIRSYSIASISGNKFALLVDTRPGGPGSRYFDALKEGDTLNFLGPFGVFVLNLEDTAEHLIMLATGSGISPIRCMAEEALNTLNTTKKITVLFGLTYPQEIFWKDVFQDLADKYDNFNYKYAIFKPDETCEDHAGFITDFIKDDFKDCSTHSAYLCGHPAMMADATELLTQNGCPKERIYKEKFYD